MRSAVKSLAVWSCTRPGAAGGRHFIWHYILKHCFNSNEEANVVEKTEVTGANRLVLSKVISSLTWVETRQRSEIHETGSKQRVEIHLHKLNLKVVFRTSLSFSLFSLPSRFAFPGFICTGKLGVILVDRGREERRRNMTATHWAWTTQ